MQYTQKNFMRIIGNDQKNNGQDFWEILERIIGKISSIIGAGLLVMLVTSQNRPSGYYVYIYRLIDNFIQWDCTKIIVSGF